MIALPSSALRAGVVGSILAELNEGSAAITPHLTLLHTFKYMLSSRLTPRCFIQVIYMGDRGE